MLLFPSPLSLSRVYVYNAVVLVHIFLCVLCCSSVTKLYPTLHNHRYCSSPGFPVPLSLPEFIQIHVLWVCNASVIWCCDHPLLSSSPAFNLSQCQGLFNESVLLIRWPNIGASTSASVIPMNIQDWLPLGLTGLISLLSRRFSRIFRFYYERCSEMFRQSLLKAILIRRIFYH